MEAQKLFYYLKFFSIRSLFTGDKTKRETHSNPSFNIYASCYIWCNVCDRIPSNELPE